MPAIVNSPLELLGRGKRYAVAFGVFDGLHRGHQAIIAHLRELAEATDALPAVMFFSPFPRNVLFPETMIPALQSPENKTRELFSLGIDTVIKCEFTRELAALSPQDFLEKYYLNPQARPHFTAFCVGDDWRFGHRNSGDAALLKRIGEDAGLRVCIVPPVWEGDKPISSTRIRQAVQEGDLPAASAMLGHPFTVSGKVNSGLGLATAKLSCPTANIRPETGSVLPPYGVYATTAILPDGQACPAIAYIGDAPTIRPNDKSAILEIHLLDRQCELYGLNLTVQFREFLRPSRKFNSPEELAAQIQDDIRRASRIIS